MSKETIVMLHCDTCNGINNVRECNICGKDVCYECKAITMPQIIVCKGCYNENVQELNKELQTGVGEIFSKSKAQTDVIYKQRERDEDALAEAIRSKLKK